jgi:hypothetical protein
MCSIFTVMHYELLLTTSLISTFEKQQPSRIYVNFPLMEISIIDCVRLWKDSYFTNFYGGKRR